jgi:hypothetical protein
MTDSVAKSIMPRSRDEDSALARHDEGDKGIIDLATELKMNSLRKI